MALDQSMATGLIQRTTTKTKSNTDLPREFKPIEEVGGMAAIAKHLMCTYTLISVLPDQFFKATENKLPILRPAFWRSIDHWGITMPMLWRCDALN